MSKVKTNIGPLINSEGELTHDNKEMSNILAEQYSKGYSKPTLSFPDVPSKNINEPLEPLDLSAEQLIKAIDELSCSAAPGPDNFPAVFLKNCKTELAKPHCKLWTTSLCQGYVPYKLKSTIIIPTFKSGSKGKAANYRP